jgi:hypothetical protein
MEEKVIKFEIGKVLAVIVVIVVIAGLSVYFLNPDLFKGTLVDTQKIEEQDMEVALQNAVDKFETSLFKDYDLAVNDFIEETTNLLPKDAREQLHDDLMELEVDINTIDYDIVLVRVQKIIERFSDQVSVNVDKGWSVVDVDDVDKEWSIGDIDDFDDV